MKPFLKDTLALVSGSILFALGVCIFASPNSITTGGASGLSIILNKFTGIQIGTGMFLINVPLFIAALFVCGKMYTLKTVYSAGVFSLIVDLAELFLPTRFVSDKLLASVFGGILIGLGMFIILSRGIVTGGSDLLAYLIQRMRPGRSISSLLLIIDGVVVIVSGIVFRSFDIMLYSLTLIIITTLVLNTFLRGRTHGAVLFIFSNCADEIRREITDKFGRGISILDVRGGYTNTPRQVVMCALTLKEAPLLKRLIYELDKNAFVINLSASDIYGEGFIRHGDIF